MCLFAPIAHASNTWVDWTSGASQPFINSSGTQGTVSYTHNLSAVSAASMNSPDTQFPFTNPIKYLRDNQLASDASIDFTFSNVSPDAQSIFTLGNLRPTNRFIITAFDQNNAAISLVTWTNHGEYRLFATDTGPNLWNPNTGVLVGNGTSQDNGLNIFFGLTSNVRRIHVDFDNVDGSFDVLDFALAGGGAPTVPMTSTWGLGILATLLTIGSAFVLTRRQPQSG
jgi:hypothetical protein